MIDWAAARCIAPGCAAHAVADTPFCAMCAKAPPAKRGGWLSAARRRQRMNTLDASNISPRLWVGATVRPDVDLPSFDLLVLCAAEHQPPQVAFHGRTLRCPMRDAELTRTELARALIVARSVAETLVAGHRVLVTCAMGLNRSALVAALALARTTRMSADQVVTLIRERRGARALSNPNFVATIRHIVADGRKYHR